jgi:hypothetical protein
MHWRRGQLRGLALWSEGQVWCSPERPGAITAVIKNQIDWSRSNRVRCGRAKVARWLPYRSEADRSLSTSYNTAAGPMDANGDNTESIVGPEGLPGIRRRGPDETFGAL